MRIIKIIFVSAILFATALWAWDRHHIDSITVMSFNIENGGTQVNFGKVVEAIKKSKADVVGLQEPWGNTARLANELGWHYYSNDQHIISRYPLHETVDGHELYTLVELKPGYVVVMANLHLPSEDYGPDLVKTHTSIKKIMTIEKTVRLPSAIPFIETLSKLTQQKIPVFLTGDFNSPSHLDWQQRTTKITWPVTQFVEKKGLTDAFRQVYPNSHFAVYTWPARRPNVTLTSKDGFNPTLEDSSDRIDFIFTGGDSVVKTAEVIGEENYPAATIHVDPWPSDHRAVVAQFEVAPVPLSKFNLKPNISAPHDQPALALNSAQIKAGQPFTISWRNMPGNRYDYIMLLPKGSKKTAWGEAVRLYTHGAVNGALTYNKSTAKGNWLAWYAASEGKWPLKPGVYEVRLMLDDSYTEVAKTELIVK